MQDILRTCNYTVTRGIATDGSTVLLRWYKAAPDAPTYPGWSAFGHPVWEGIYRDDFLGAGCQYADLQWCPCAWPCTGTYQPIGSPSDFEFGPAALAGPGSPCCSTPSILPGGGGMVGGTGWAPLTRNASGSTARDTHHAYVRCGSWVASGSTALDTHSAVPAHSAAAVSGSRVADTHLAAQIVRAPAVAGSTARDTHHAYARSGSWAVSGSRSRDAHRALLVRGAAARAGSQVADLHTPAPRLTAAARAGSQVADLHTPAPVIAAPAVSSSAAADTHLLPSVHDPRMVSGTVARDTRHAEPVIAARALDGTVARDTRHAEPVIAARALDGAMARDVHAAMQPGIVTDCCSSVPATLTATFTGCDCLTGHPVTMNYTGSAQTWSGSTAFCPDYEITVTLQCNVGAWTCKVSYQPFGSPSEAPSSESCDPFDLVFHFLAGTFAPCPSAFTVEITG